MTWNREVDLVRATGRLCSICTNEIHTNEAQPTVALLDAAQPRAIEAILRLPVNEPTSLEGDAVLILDDDHLVGSAAA
jgi:hypothetical protein